MWYNFSKYLVFLPPLGTRELFGQFLPQNKQMELIIPDVKKRSIAMF